MTIVKALSCDILHYATRQIKNPTSNQSVVEQFNLSFAALRQATLISTVSNMLDGSSYCAILFI